MRAFAELVPRGLIVSCQAARGDAFHGSEFMVRMALAAQQGGAVGIRANGRADIVAIRTAARLPVIGLLKTLYPNSPVTITPTLAEAAEVAQAGAAVVALDATNRTRPRGETLAGLIRRVRDELGVPVLADVSTLEEGVNAVQLGADAVATTLAGYIGEISPDHGPKLRLVADLVARVSVPVVAEGGYESPDDAARALGLGAYAVVVGTAITRPQAITQRFVAAIARTLRPDRS